MTPPSAGFSARRSESAGIFIHARLALIVHGDGRVAGGDGAGAVTFDNWNGKGWECASNRDCGVGEG
jgi:hypothetical protein